MRPLSVGRVESAFHQRKIIIAEIPPFCKENTAKSFPRKAAPAPELITLTVTGFPCPSLSPVNNSERQDSLIAGSRQTGGDKAGRRAYLRRRGGAGPFSPDGAKGTMASQRRHSGPQKRARARRRRPLVYASRPQSSPRIPPTTPPCGAGPRPALCSSAQLIDGH